MSKLMNSDSFNVLKSALARWQAKNNYMLEKYRRILRSVALTEVERNTIEGLIEDLSTPADNFISELDFCEGSKKCV